MFNSKDVRDDLFLLLVIAICFIGGAFGLPLMIKLFTGASLK